MGYLKIHGFTIQARLDMLFYVCTNTICFDFCVNLHFRSEFTETLSLTIDMDILDTDAKMDGYGWITQFG